MRLKSQLISFSALMLINIHCSSPDTIKDQTLISDNGLPNMEVIMNAKSGSEAQGKLVLVQGDKRLKIVGKLSGLSPNSEHGFHIHEKGDCSADDAKSAGGHFAPQGHKHGAPFQKKHHAGDLGNIKSNSKGVATFDKSYTTINLNGDNKFSIIGKAFVVHAKADDLKSQPSGAAGKRIACGTVKPANGVN